MIRLDLPEAQNGQFCLYIGRPGSNSIMISIYVFKARFRHETWDKSSGALFTRIVNEILQGMRF